MARWIAALFTIITLITNISYAQYFGAEFYPSPNGDIFVYAGKDIVPDRLKVDLWATPNTEVACTIGPKIGIFAIGVGASAGKAHDKVNLTYLNADLAFGLDLGAARWQSSNCYQLGQNDVDNFFLSRQKINFGGAISIFNHNTKAGAEEWHLNLGLSCNFGKIWLFDNNQLVLTKNVTGDGAFIMWSIGS